jgi:hypothetical protein
MNCPNCKSDEILILSILIYGNKYKCQDCGDTFVIWNKGVNYVGNTEFNDWYDENKTELYDIAEDIVLKIGDILTFKDWSDDYKIVATNIILENIIVLCMELGIQDEEEEIANRLQYKGRNSKKSRSRR